MVWLRDGEKNLKICLFVSIKSTNVTDGQTPHDGIDRAWIASRGKNDILSERRSYVILFDGAHSLCVKHD